MCVPIKNLWRIENLSSLTAHHKSFQNNQGGFGGRLNNCYAETSRVSPHLGIEGLRNLGSLSPTNWYLECGRSLLLVIYKKSDFNKNKTECTQKDNSKETNQ